MTQQLDYVLSHLPGYKKTGNHYMALCPAHDDHNPSLQVSVGDDGKILLHCHGNCDKDDVLKAMGIKMSDLFPKPNGRGATASSRVSAKQGKTENSAFEGLEVTDRYRYVDPGNNLVFTVLRWEDPKGVRKKQFTQSPIDKYKLKNIKANKSVMHGVPKFIYRLPKVAKTVKTDFPVIVVEGEKDVKNLEKLGFVATSGSGGACKWLAEYGESLRGGNIIIIPDNDDPGRKHALMVARSIVGKAKRIRMLNLPDLPVKGDASDWLASGGTKEKLIELAKACPDWEMSPECDESLDKQESKNSKETQQRTFVSEEDKVKALDSIEAAIAQKTATAIYNDEVITAIAIFEEGERADIVQRICSAIKSVTKRDIKKKITQKMRELDPVTYNVDPPDGMVAQVLSPNTPIKDSCDEALTFLVEHNDPMRLFRRGGRMSRLRQTDQGTMKIEELEKEGITFELTNLIDFCYVNPEDGTVRHVSAPKFIVDYLYAHPRLPFSVIDGITEIPVLRRDGTILCQRGYDRGTRMYYYPPDNLVVPPIPDVPTTEQKCEAAELLREVFCDMPFVSEVDRTHTIALLLSPVLRQITGTTPLALINAHQPSNGKSLISDIISLIITGRTANNSTAPTDPKEWESYLGALLFSGEPLVFFDNVKHYIESESLEKVLTSEEVTSRVLGKSSALTVTNRITFALTGNNIQIGREIRRRSYLIDLDAQMSNPEDRPTQSYRHADLREWTVENRGLIVWALFVIVRAWFADNKPAYNVPQIGSFERWAMLVGNILTHAGFGDFLGNRDKLKKEADQESAQWEAFLQRWLDIYGDRSMTVAEVSSDLGWQDKLGGVIPDDLSFCIRGNEQDNVRIGRTFRRREGSRFGDNDLRLHQAGLRNGNRTWAVLHKVDSLSNALQNKLGSQSGDDDDASSSTVLNTVEKLGDAHFENSEVF